MKLQLFGYGITGVHFYRSGKFHVCEFKDCPSRLPPAAVKYVIVRHDIGALSERFDTKEDADRAIRFFGSPLYGQEFGVLETVRALGGWMIGDPEIPESAGITFLNSRYLQRPDIEEHGCTSCRACEVSHCRICAPCGKPEPPPKGVSSSERNRVSR